VRHDWSLTDVQALYDQPLLELVFQAQGVHRRFHDPTRMQQCSLLSIKTGGCPEDCGYCPQSAHHEAAVDRQPLMTVPDVLAVAQRAKDAGASRFCMGAAWRDAKQGVQFEQVLDMVRGVSELGMEACATLGMLTPEQAKSLKDAGLTAYNHNLDTSAAHYEEIISTRTYAERLQTLGHVQDAGIDVCCGGILGLGETAEDRCSLLQTLAGFDPHPESVPINVLVKVAGTPLGTSAASDVHVFEVVRSIATARILMPRTRVRLSAGREGMSPEGQALCFMAGANSIFFGEELLTTSNPSVEQDMSLLETLGMTPG